jgi:hypothetical protein
MAVTDVSAVDNAVLNRLVSDAQLLALTPDGVHWDVAPQGSTKFVIVTRAEAERELALGDADGFERLTYTIKAVINSTSVSPANDAAYRIHELFHRATLDIVGYTFMLSERVFPIRYAEVDPENAAGRWHHHGGQYQVMVCPAE